MDERAVISGQIRTSSALNSLGLSAEMIANAITFTHETLDALDLTLLTRNQPRMAQLIELANLSAMIGNVFRSGIELGSEGAFRSNAPHTYPDLLGIGDGCADVEIKVALGTNNPKGHLIKPGPHLIIRYVLGDSDGTFRRDTRGAVAWIWEVRLGVLERTHFNFSNTAGDSGKTAVINAAGLQALDAAYFDLARCPHPPKSKHLEQLRNLFGH